MTWLHPPALGFYEHSAPGSLNVSLYCGILCDFRGLENGLPERNDASCRRDSWDVFRKCHKSCDTIFSRVLLWGRCVAYSAYASGWIIFFIWISVFWMVALKYTDINKRNPHIREGSAMRPEVRIHSCRT